MDADEVILNEYSADLRECQIMCDLEFTKSNYLVSMVYLQKLYVFTNSLQSFHRYNMFHYVLYTYFERYLHVLHTNDRVLNERPQKISKKYEQPLIYPAMEE